MDNSTLTSSLAEYLREEGLSQREFASMAGVDPSIVSRLVRRQMTPRLDLAAKIERLTGGAVRAISWVDGCEASPSAIPAEKGAA